MLIVLSAAGTAMAQNQPTPSNPQVKAFARMIPAAVTIPPAPRPNDPPKPKQPGIHRS